MHSARHACFHHLHHQSEPLLLPNVWDARSAAVCQKNGYLAVGTSSAAIASALGFADGEQLTFADLLPVVARICAATTLPVSVDLEAGYSRDVTTICAHLAQLHALGVVGINLEDSLVKEENRYLVDAADFARTIAQIKAFCLAHDMPLFLNVRTDAYLLGVPDALRHTEARMHTYATAGADGLFVPGLAEVEAMRHLCRHSPLPVNVMCVPGLPGWEDLTQAGIRRVSMGNFLFEFLAHQQERVGAQIRQTKQFNALFQ